MPHFPCADTLHQARVQQWLDPFHRALFRHPERVPNFLWRHALGRVNTN
jgi:hypothetical protein